MAGLERLNPGAVAFLMVCRTHWHGEFIACLGSHSFVASIVHMRGLDPASTGSADAAIAPAKPSEITVRRFMGGPATVFPSRGNINSHKCLHNLRALIALTVQLTIP